MPYPSDGQPFADHRPSTPIRTSTVWRGPPAIAGATRSLGRALGEALARAIPDRRRRIAAIVAIAVLGAGTLFYVLLHTGRFGAQLAIFFVLSLAMGVLRRFLRRHGVVD